MKEYKWTKERTFSSSITHGAQSGCPKLMAPKIGTETRSPLLPNWTYSALVAATESLIDWGISVVIEDIFLRSFMCWDIKC